MLQRLDNWATRLALAAPPGIVEEPHPLLIALLVVVSGGAALAAGGQSAPQSVQHALPPWLVLVWGVFGATGGILSLLGLVLRGLIGRLGAMAWERAGNTLLSPAALAYGLALLSQGSARAVVAAALAIAVGTASAIYAYTRRPGLYQRILARQIIRELRSAE